MKLSADAPPKGTIRDWLDDRARTNAPCLVFPETGEKLLWRDLQKRAKDLASAFTEQGIPKGSSIAVMMPNGRDGVVALFAALYGGFRATMINLTAGRDAIAYALTHSEAAYACVDPSADVLFEQTAPKHLTRFNLATSSTSEQLHPVSAQDQALLMYTSGTTGTPKGVIHTHASLLAGGWTTAIAHELTEQDVGLCVLPIYHINGLCVTVMGGLVSGGSLIMASRFSASNFWHQAIQYDASWFSVVPTIISHLLHSENAPPLGGKTRLRFGRSASSALAIETQSAFESRFGVPIVETMGLTETAAQILSNPLPPGVRKIGSPGVAFGCRVEIQDQNGLPVPQMEEGEIVVQGPNVMQGYFKNPTATEATFRHGWLRTGDLGRMDADGYVYVTGRLKELIIKGGENIAPREIDEALYAHPDVVEAAAFARPCTSYGERVEAAVALCHGSNLNADDLILLCRERVGAFKSPDKVHVLPELPKGPSGKIQRLKLADLLHDI